MFNFFTNNKDLIFMIYFLKTNVVAPLTILNKDISIF